MMKKILAILSPILFLTLTSCLEPESCAVDVSTGKKTGNCSRVKVNIVKLEPKSIGGYKHIYDMFGGGVIKSNSSITIHGISSGDIKIEKNAKLVINGIAEGNIENYGELKIYGSLDGDIINYNNVTIGGTVNGKLYGDGYKFNSGSVINGEPQS